MGEVDQALRIQHILCSVSGFVELGNSGGLKAEQGARLEGNSILANGIIHHLYHYRNTRQTLGLREGRRGLLS